MGTQALYSMCFYLDTHANISGCHPYVECLCFGGVSLRFTVPLACLLRQTVRVLLPPPSPVLCSGAVGPGGEPDEHQETVHVRDRHEQREEKNAGESLQPRFYSFYVVSISGGRVRVRV